MRRMFFPLTLIILAALVMAACTGGPGTTGAQPTSQIPSTGGTAQSGTAQSTAATGGTTGAETPSAVGTTSPTSGATTGGATGAATGEATGMATGTTPSGGSASGGLTATDTVAVPTSNSATSGSTGVNPTAETGSANGATTSTPGVGPVTGGTTGTGATTGTPAAGATSGSNAGTTTGTATIGGTNAGGTTGTPAAGMTTGTATTGGTTSGGETTGTPSASATTGSATSGGTTSGGATASTPAATLSGPVPSAGSQTQGLYVRMSELLNANVNAQSSAQVGRVDGLMLERPLVAGVETTGTPIAPTATPVPMTGNQGIFVRYLMVNVSGAQAQSGGSTSGNGNEVMVPWGAVATSAAGTVTLNVSSSAFASAPRVSMLDVVSGSTAWSSPAVAYWSGQGLSIPNTGSTTTGNATGSSLVFIPRERGGINITDEKDTVLGSVSDLLINPTSGEVVYAVFESGQAFGNRVFVLPMRSLLWVASSAGVSVADRGAFHLNFNSDLLKNAPSLNSLNQLQVSPALINQLNAFWNSAIQALPVITTTPAPK